VTDILVVHLCDLICIVYFGDSFLAVFENRIDLVEEFVTSSFAVTLSVLGKYTQAYSLCSDTLYLLTSVVRYLIVT